MTTYEIIWIEGLMVVNYSSKELWIGTPPECEALNKENVQKLADFINGWLGDSND